MSLLAEVLDSASQVGLELINSKVPEVTLEVQRCKDELEIFMEETYLKFSKKPQRNKCLMYKIDNVHEKLSSLKDTFEDIKHSKIIKANGEFENHVRAIEKYSVEAELLRNIYEIHSGLLRLKEANSLKNYEEAIDELILLEQKQETLHSGWLIAENLKEKISMQSQIIINLASAIKDSIVMEVNDVYSLKIRSTSTHLESGLKAFYKYYNKRIFHLDKLTKFVWGNIFVPIVDHETSVLVSNKDDFFVLTVEVTKEKRPIYTNVFSNLKIVLKFLSETLGLHLDENVTALEYIGQDLGDNLSELIIKHCLHYSIPSTSEELQKFNAVIEETKLLEQALKESHIFQEHTASILEYANNVDVLFINKKCQSFIEQAINIMKDDLHEMMEVGTPYDPNIFLNENNEFLKCSVSKNVEKLIKLIMDILEMMQSASDVNAGRLLCTVQKICTLYTKFVPEHHNKLLETIPQQIALFHNNCKYLSHHLKQWHMQHKIPSVLNIASAFKDEIIQLEQVGNGKLAEFVTVQINQIQLILKEANLENRQTLEKLEINTEKLARQCLRQMELLKTVWHKVLNYTTYNNTLGAMLNSMCSYLINLIIRYEDIEAEAAKTLVDILKIIQNRGPKVLTDAKEVHMYVPSWHKFTEIIYVLNGSLTDINDRWADGKGPLALQFKADELKQLIRALFQNTDRRAAVLAKISY